MQNCPNDDTEMIQGASAGRGSAICPTCGYTE